MHLKYSRNSHPVTAPCLSSASHIWKRITLVRDQMESFLIWDIHSGSASFWFDNWLGTGALYTRIIPTNKALVRDFLDGDRWNFDLLKEVVPNDIILEIKGIHLALNNTSDHLYWSLESSGLFSITSAYSIMRSRKSSLDHKACFVSKEIPITHSIFMARIWCQRIPVDTNLFCLNVHGPSKCNCCVSTPQVESFDHLFVSGQLAKDTWSFFENFFPFSSAGMTFKDKCLVWWSFQSSCPLKNLLVKLLPIYILWFCWRARNAARYDGLAVQFHHVTSQITIFVTELLHAWHPKWKVSSLPWHDLMRLSVPKSRSVIFVKWMLPPFPFFKLNIHGCAKGLPSLGSGGGIIRNSQGQILFAFSCFFGRVSSIQAEARALLIGLALSALKGFRLIQVDMNSTVLLNAMSSEKQAPWASASIIRTAKKFGFLVHSYHHTLKEANLVADSLANVGFNQKQFVVYHSFHELPLLVKQHIRADALNLGSLRYR